MHFYRLRVANIERDKEYTDGVGLSPLFRAVELGGEVGEVLNKIKKYFRAKEGLRGTTATLEEIADEIADVIISADLLAMELEIDLQAVIIRKFNATSDKLGLVTKLDTNGDIEI